MNHESKINSQLLAGKIMNGENYQWSPNLFLQGCKKYVLCVIYFHVIEATPGIPVVVVTVQQVTSYLNISALISTYISVEIKTSTL